MSHLRRGGGFSGRHHACPEPSRPNYARAIGDDRRDHAGAPGRLLWRAQEEEAKEEDPAPEKSRPRARNQGARSAPRREIAGRGPNSSPNSPDSSAGVPARDPPDSRPARARALLAPRSPPPPPCARPRRGDRPLMYRASPPEIWNMGAGPCDGM
ncbi:hypothetical protein NL676_035373 [Syzygium grande]|nr:hypothetical protein NL676_035373 [Syzygium grande]